MMALFIEWLQIFGFYNHSRTALLLSLHILMNYKNGCVYSEIRGKDGILKTIFMCRERV